MFIRAKTTKRKNYNKIGVLTVETCVRFPFRYLWSLETLHFNNFQERRRQAFVKDKHEENCINWKKQKTICTFFLFLKKFRWKKNHFLLRKIYNLIFACLEGFKAMQFMRWHHSCNNFRFSKKQEKKQKKDGRVRFLLRHLIPIFLLNS